MNRSFLAVSAILLWACSGNESNAIALDGTPAEATLIEAYGLGTTGSQISSQARDRASGSPGGYSYQPIDIPDQTDFGCRGLTGLVGPFRVVGVQSDGSAELAAGTLGGTAHVNCPGDGDCCESNGSVGCENFDCCEVVCGTDGYCCDTIWDATCAGHAEDLCGDLCNPPLCPPGAEGDCCTANGTPGCADADCCEAVCTEDSLCCEASWNALCAQIAEDYPEECACGLSPMACCLIDGGCEDLFEHECTNDVGVPRGEGTACLTDGDSNGIDDACESICPAEAEGDCCSANSIPGCEDAQCCRLVCLADSSCCDLVWDSICAGTALDLCPVCSPPLCPPEATGDCCNENGTPGCDIFECCELVCQDDPACCNADHTDGWDLICAGAAAELCGSLCDCTSFGDFDGNGTWNLVDYDHFEACLSGPGGGPVGLDYLCGDQWGDLDVDLADGAAFFNLFDSR